MIGHYQRDRDGAQAVESVNTRPAPLLPLPVRAVHAAEPIGSRRWRYPARLGRGTRRDGPARSISGQPTHVALVAVGADWSILSLVDHRNFRG